MLNRPLLQLALIAAIGFLSYSNTFDVPFLFDDSDVIVENPIIKDMGYFSFALNYRLNGLDVKGYHVVNLAIHILNAVLVYFLVVLTFRTPFISDAPLRKHDRHIARFSALLFISHPVQTQAVTYIAQRFASLATMFYLLSLVAYIKSRLSLKKAACISLYLLSLASAVLAMKTKQTAFTLPLIIALYELFFFTGRIKRRLIYLVPILFTMLMIPMTLINVDRPFQEIIGDASEKTAITSMPRLDYLLTESRVIVTYLRLLMLPVKQNLDYDYPLYNSFFDPQVFLSLLFLLTVFGLGIYFMVRSSRDHVLRLVAFGIFWFFLALSVESSIIPLHVIYEHRVYLPSVGAFSAISTVAILLIEVLDGKLTRKVAISFLVFATLVFSAATYARNTVWKSDKSIWKDVVKKSPGKVRGYLNLGNAYKSRKLIDEAIEYFQTATKLDPDEAKAHNNLGNAYREKGLTDKAIEHLHMALRLDPDLQHAYNNLGIIYKASGQIDKAIEHYLLAIQLKPSYAKAHNNLGNAYRDKGLTDKAIEHYRIAMSLNPDIALTYNNLGIIYGAKGLFDRAIDNFKTALRLDPEYVTAYYNLGNAYGAKELYDRAIEQYEIALRLKPDYAEAYNNLGNAYRDKGLFDRAIEYYETALRLKPDYAEAHLNLGLVYLRKGLMDRARGEFDTALKINPNLTKARWALDQANRIQSR
jgi:tetratricopeptide (TPR) repeat protein